jgi:hypothetical protein
VTLGQVFSEYFGFPCQVSFHRLLHIHHLSSGAGTNRAISGLSLTTPKKTKKKLPLVLIKHRGMKTYGEVEV